MPQKTQATHPTSADVKHLFRQADDHTVAEILALQPSYAQLEEAAARIEVGAEEFLADRGSEDLIVSQIVELIGTEIDEENQRRQ